MSELKAKYIEGLEKRYWIFVSEHYYPRGGMGDYIGSADHLVQVGSILKERYSKDKGYFDWKHHVKNECQVTVLDKETNKLLYF